MWRHATVPVLYGAPQLRSWSSQPDASRSASGEVSRPSWPKRGVGGAVLLADYLQKTEGVPTVFQWIPSQVGVLGDEIANGLANEGRSMAQPRKPLTLSDAWSVLQRGTAKLWSAAQLSNDDQFPHFHEAHKAGDYLQGLSRKDAVQIFRTRAKHTLLLTKRLVCDYCLSFLRRTGRDDLACFIRMP
ncbi:hypothetical protein PoB_007131500 [Plakobranchus ocellatus]|uniref:Uncharacterized protein n=1 Tax=Plakobranchus ocellatus TaxID=259542 RepID=A0AAV4DLE8_9GAST|nr:hypothetical protein PoB_007131500 [Plakobranchus ocellatus]